jgi:GNAT superfamily N-acetyltransferase
VALETSAGHTVPLDTSPGPTVTLDTSPRPTVTLDTSPRPTVTLEVSAGHSVAGPPDTSAGCMVALEVSAGHTVAWTRRPAGLTGVGVGRRVVLVVDDAALLRAYDEQMRGIGNPGHPGLVVERDGPVLRAAGQHRGLVTGPRDLGVSGAELDALIARQREYFRARNEAVEWKTRGHDLPADLTDRLRAAGFVPEDQETVVIGVTADLATDPVLPKGTTLREVTTDAGLRAIVDLEGAVWNEDLSWLGDELIARKNSDPDGIMFFAVTDDAAGQVVSAAWTVFYPGTEFAYLAGGSTLEAWRRQGIYRALVAVRAQRAAARGTRYVTVDASDDSAPILRRLGLRPVTTTTPYVWTPPTPT